MSQFSNVRYINGEFHKRCDGCVVAKGAAWWPLTLEFWAPAKGMLVCRACHLERQRQRRCLRESQVGPAADAKRAYQREWARAKRLRDLRARQRAA